MFLQKLVEFSHRLNLPPTLYSMGTVRYLVDLDGHGRFVGRVDTADASQTRTRRGERRLVPQVARSVAVKPLLLADNAEYTFGLARDTSKPERVHQCHEAYLEQLAACAASTQDAGAAAVLKYLQDDPAAVMQAAGYEVGGDAYDRSGTVTFRVDGVPVVDSVAVQRFWARWNEPAEAPRMQCLICGQARPILDRLQGKVRGIPGGQTAGTSVISANAPAFESYGLEASLTAPTCSDCGERFTKALNYLIEHQSSRLAGTVYVYWTAEAGGDTDFMHLLDVPEENEVRALLDSVFSGHFDPSIEPKRFYAAALTASGGRAVVREWIDTTVGQAKLNLGRWFARQAVVDVNTGEQRHFGLRALAGATVKRLDDIAAPTTRSLLRHAVQGGVLPPDLMSEAVRRAQADGGLNAAHVSLIKLVLLSSVPDRPTTGGEDELVSLQPDHPNPGYQCGRLMAVLDHIQRRAIPNVKSGVADRYFSTASSAPHGVFPRLLGGARPHLRVIRQDRPPQAAALEAQLDEIIDRLKAPDVEGEPAFPRVLTLSDQGLFQVGYHHQRAADRAAARAGARSAPASATSTASPGDDEQDGLDE